VTDSLSMAGFCGHHPVAGKCPRQSISDPAGSRSAILPSAPRMGTVGPSPCGMNVRLRLGLYFIVAAYPSLPIGNMARGPVQGGAL